MHKNYGKMITTRISEDLHSRLKAHAKKHDLKIKNIFECALIDYLGKKEIQNPRME